MLRRRTAILPLLTLILVCSAFASGKPRKKDPPTIYKVGVILHQFNAPEGYNWRGSDDRTITGMIWYPAEAAAELSAHGFVATFEEKTVLMGRTKSSPGNRSKKG